MFSYIKYRKRFLLHFLLDLLFVGAITVYELYLLCHKPMFKEAIFFNILIVMVVFGALRLAVLVNWLVKSIVVRNTWLSIFSAFHLVILGTGLWWSIFFIMLFSGAVGITPDGN